MSRRMGKPTIYIGENKDADQLRSNCEADQRLCFRYTDSRIHPLLILKNNVKILAFSYTGRFVSELVGNPNCLFSHAQTCLLLKLSNNLVVGILIEVTTGREWSVNDY